MNNFDFSRPVCSVPDCGKPAVRYRWKSDGSPAWRRANWIKERYPHVDDVWCCHTCHNKETARRNGVKTALDLTAKRKGFDNAQEYRNYTLTLTAQKYGFDNIRDYLNSIHPYLKYRKDYCENIDGRLGFVCTYTPPTEVQLIETGLDKSFKAWLQVDHKDGDRTNNHPTNLQTLCACCHTIKTHQNRDYDKSDKNLAEIG